MRCKGLQFSSGCRKRGNARSEATCKVQKRLELTNEQENFEWSPMGFKVSDLRLKLATSIQDLANYCPARHA